MLSDREKKIGVVFSCFETAVAVCGSWPSIEAIDAPSTRLADPVLCFGLATEAVSGPPFSVGLVDFVGGVGDAAPFAGWKIFSANVTGGSVASAVIAGAVLSCFTGVSGCAETGGTLAVCGLTTNSGLGAGIIRRIEASPALSTGSLCSCLDFGVEWDTGRAGASFAFTRSLFWRWTDCKSGLSCTVDSCVGSIVMVGPRSAGRAML